jgi:hypothetical protein
MTDAETVDEAALTSAQGPKRVKSGQREIEEHSIADQIALSKHLANVGITDPFACLRNKKIVPPGGG